MIISQGSLAFFCPGHAITAVDLVAIALGHRYLHCTVSAYSGPDVVLDILKRDSHARRVHAKDHLGNEVEAFEITAFSYNNQNGLTMGVDTYQFASGGYDSENSSVLRIPFDTLRRLYTRRVKGIRVYLAEISGDVKALFKIDGSDVYWNCWPTEIPACVMMLLSHYDAQFGGVVDEIPRFKPGDPEREAIWKFQDKEVF